MCAQSSLWETGEEEIQYLNIKLRVLEEKEHVI